MPLLCQVLYLSDLVLNKVIKSYIKVSIFCPIYILDLHCCAFFRLFFLTFLLLSIQLFEMSDSEHFKHVYKGVCVCCI